MKVVTVKTDRFGLVTLNFSLEAESATADQLTNLEAFFVSNTSDTINKYDRFGAILEEVQAKK